MIIEEIRDIKSGRTELRRFGISFCIVFALISSILWLKNKDYYPYFFILSFMFLLFGLTVPGILKPLHKIWMILAIIIGWIMTRVILIILFYLIVTPIGLFAKIFRKEFLDLEFSKNANSYWVLRPENKLKLKNRDYQKQF